MQSGDPNLKEDGCHGLWELSINRENHPDVGPEPLAVILNMIDEEDIKVYSLRSDQEQ
jgi:hypothetical protein